jgi:hypothetical protein
MASTSFEEVQQPREWWCGGGMYGRWSHLDLDRELAVARFPRGRGCQWQQ